MAKVSGWILIDGEKCKGCELCIAVCPKEVIHLASVFNARGYRPARLVDPEGSCTGCVLCALVCPDALISVYRSLRSGVESAIQEAIA